MSKFGIGYIHTSLIDRLRTYNANAKDVIATIPVAMVKPDDAARLVLQGVEKNRAIIKFPSYVGLLTFLYRFVPNLFARQSLKTIRDFRKIRKEGNGLSQKGQ